MGQETHGSDLSHITNALVGRRGSECVAEHMPSPTCQPLIDKAQAVTFPG